MEKGTWVMGFWEQDERTSMCTWSRTWQQSPSGSRGAEARYDDDDDPQHSGGGWSTAEVKHGQEHKHRVR